MRAICKIRRRHDEATTLPLDRSRQCERLTLRKEPFKPRRLIINPPDRTQFGVKLRDSDRYRRHAATDSDADTFVVEVVKRDAIKRTDIKDEWGEERSFQQEFGEVHFIGDFIKVGAACHSSQHLNGLLGTKSGANDTPDLLPRFAKCRHDTCKCEYELVSPKEVPKGTRVAEWSDPERQANPSVSIMLDE